jgi:hypothetical protein
MTLAGQNACPELLIVFNTFMFRFPMSVDSVPTHSFELVMANRAHAWLAGLKPAL